MRLIDADALKEKAFGKRGGLIHTSDIDEMPTAQPHDYSDGFVDGYKNGVKDTQPQRTGKWEITDALPHNVYCSECHKRYAQTHWAVWEDGSLPRNFCPNCGAKME